MPGVLPCEVFRARLSCVGEVSIQVLYMREAAELQSFYPACAGQKPHTCRQVRRATNTRFQRTLHTRGLRDAGGGTVDFTNILASNRDTNAARMHKIMTAGLLLCLLELASGQQAQSPSGAPSQAELDQAVDAGIQFISAQAPSQIQGARDLQTAIASGNLTGDFAMLLWCTPCISC